MKRLECKTSSLYVQWLCALVEIDHIKPFQLLTPNSFRASPHSPLLPPVSVHIKALSNACRYLTTQTTRKMLTESIAFFKNYDRLHCPAQDADMQAYVYSKELWDDIDLREDPLRQAPTACQCQNPFCDNHGTEDEDLNQEWASMEQKSSKPEKHAITSDPTGHSHKRQKLTVLEDKSPKAVKISGAPRNSTLLRNRRARTRENIC